MKFYIVDCFAEAKYQGNELLVVLADRPVSDEEQQQIAREINFSETTFIFPSGESATGKRENGGYDVRIWTPNVGEVPFAGHPTLGTAHVIYNYIENKQADKIILNLKVGQIPVDISESGLTMSQNPPQIGETVSPDEIADIYGIGVCDIRDNFPIQWVSTGLEAVIVPLRSRKTLSKLETDQNKFKAYIKRHPKCNCNHLFFVDMEDGTLAARCLMEDFVEDPATGSANGDLAGYLLYHNYFGKQNIAYTVIQGEDMGRKSLLHIKAAFADGSWDIKVGGRCYTVAMGEWE